MALIEVEVACYSLLAGEDPVECERCRKPAKHLFCLDRPHPQVRWMRAALCDEHRKEFEESSSEIRFS